MSFDLSPLYRSAIGFDRFASLLEEARRSDSQNSFPPYNIELLNEDRYRITMAIAGFAEADIDIELEGDTLTVVGKTEKPSEQPKFLHQGIAARNFQRRFKLADHVKVENASMEHGLLHIELQREIPEVLKPRKISISGSAPKAAPIEAKASAA